MDTTTLLLAAIVPIMVIGAIVLVMRRRNAAPAEPIYFRCPGCRRKIKYMPKQGGNKGQCSNCKTDLIFPKV